jgi:hypothetical protein
VLADELMAMGIECFRVLFPKGMDANEYAPKVTPAEKSLDSAAAGRFDGGNVSSLARGFTTGYRFGDRESRAQALGRNGRPLRRRAGDLNRRSAHACEETPQTRHALLFRRRETCGLN